MEWNSAKVLMRPAFLSYKDQRHKEKNHRATSLMNADAEFLNKILKEVKAFLLRSGIRQGCQLSPLLFNMVVEVAERIVGEEKEIKGIKTGKNEVKTSITAGDLIEYMENPKHWIKRLFKLITQFSNTAGYKINKKSSIFIHNDGLSDREIRH